MRKICHCHAQPVRDGEMVSFYKPTDEEIKNLCKEPAKWDSCPRYTTFEKYLEALNTQKKK
jgi:hypothetical protein